MHFEQDLDLYEEAGDPRLLFANYTSGLLIVNSTLLAVAAAAGLIGGALLLALYYLANVSQSSSDYGYGYQQYSRGFRSEGGSGTTGSDILTLLSVASDIYSKMNYDDLDCQQKVICEFMEEDMFGQGGKRVKSGVKWAASWLKPFGFQIVDQISKAASLDQEGECAQRYKECQKISLKDTYKQKSEEVKKVENDLKEKKKDTAEKPEETEYEYEYYYEDRK